jgi:HJR/Mrr/RecB family endonuclease
MARIKDYHIWYHNTHGCAPEGPGLPHVEEYLLSLKPVESVRITIPTTLTEVQSTGIDVVSPSIRVILDLQAQRLKLENVDWRQFEELVAELLRNDGYTVNLTKKTRDGGVDIFAEKSLPKMGTILSIWQAKKLKEGNKVGLRTIRELADTRNQFKASKGVIVTSTSLTRGAIRRIQSDKYILEGFQKPELMRWISHYRQSRSVADATQTTSPPASGE